MTTSIPTFIGRLLASKTAKGIWAKFEQTEDGSEIIVRVGLTKETVESLGMVEFVRVLPKGHLVTRGHPFGSVECGVRVVLLRSPVSGWIVGVNDKLKDRPELINEDPYGEGWIALFRPINYEEDIKYLSELTK